MGDWRRLGEEIAVNGPALTASTLRLAIEDVLQRAERDSVRTPFIGIESQQSWKGAPEIRIDRGVALIRDCPSPLAFREALTEIPQENQFVVLVTRSSESDLGQDVLARIARSRLHSLDRSILLQDRFGATSIDPEVFKAGAGAGATGPSLADALLEVPSSVEWKAPGGVLDVGSAWTLFTQQQLRVDGDPTTVDGWIAWTADDAAAARFASLDGALRDALRAWLADRIGPIVRPLFALIEDGRADDVVPMGLALRVVPAPDEPAATESPALRDAAIRLESRLGGPVQSSWRLLWAEAAEKLVRRRRLDARDEEVDVHFRRAAELLEELGARDHAGASAILPIGFDARLQAVVAQLRGAVDRDAKATRAGLDAAFETLRAHERSRDPEANLDAIEMATRLGRWLLEQREKLPAAPGSFSAAATRQLAEGSFVDVARAAIVHGHSVPVVAELFRRLIERTTELREQQNAEFGRLLSGWLDTGSNDGVVPLEEVVTSVVAPLVDSAGVLLLVLDGMSVANFIELAPDLEERGLVEVLPTDARRLPGIAVLPTETKFSRTSLFCGKLVVGDAAAEKDGLAAHPALRAKGVEARVFHKDELVGADGVGLSEEVRRRLAQPSKNVVGIVLNAIDDWLAKGDQHRIHWDTTTIKPLDQILDAAREGGRYIVITSDHGHVVERDSTARPTADGEARYRPATKAAASDEVALRGRRVLAGERAGIVAPWSERVRYGQKRCGYHGGASPQEVVVPVTTWATDLQGAEKVGMKETTFAAPLWWSRWNADSLAPELPIEARAPAKRAKPPATTRRAADAEKAPLLFEAPKKVVEESSVAERVAREAAVGDWIERLFSTPLYAEQRKKAARLAVQDAVVVRILRELDRRGGKLSRIALARAAELPAARLQGYLAALQRLLSIDGYAAITEDAATETIELHRSILFDQFELKE